MWCVNLLEEHRLRFKDAVRNTKPTLASVQRDIDEYYEAQQIERNLERLLSEWLSGEQKETSCSKTIVEIIRLLVRRDQSQRFLKTLRSCHDLAIVSSKESFGWVSFFSQHLLFSLSITVARAVELIFCCDSQE